MRDEILLRVVNTVGVKVNLAGGCREIVLVIKDEVGPVDNFGGEAQKSRLVFGVRIQHGRGARFELEGM